MILEIWAIASLTQFLFSLWFRLTKIYRILDVEDGLFVDMGMIPLLNVLFVLLLIITYLLQVICHYINLIVLNYSILLTDIELKIRKINKK